MDAKLERNREIFESREKDVKRCLIKFKDLVS